MGQLAKDIGDACLELRRGHWTREGSPTAGGAPPARAESPAGCPHYLCPVPGGCGGGQHAACLPFPGRSLPLTHRWNVTDSPAPEFPKGLAFRPWDEGIPAVGRGHPSIVSPRNSGEHGRQRPAEPTRLAALRLGRPLPPGTGQCMVQGFPWGSPDGGVLSQPALSASTSPTAFGLWLSCPARGKPLLTAQGHKASSVLLVKPSAPASQGTSVGPGP